MLQELKKEANHTTTENGAPTHRSTMNYCLDLFATIGALRNASEYEIICRFARAYAENSELAMKILFYARDIRGGLGERRVFHIILKFLADHYGQSLRKNLWAIAEYGRFDDMLVLLDKPCAPAVLEVLKVQLKEDIQAAKLGKDSISLLAKWLPSVNTSNQDKVRLGRKLAKEFGMTEKQYRKTLSMLRKKIDIIENHLREKDYTFDYEKQAGKALFKYREAFARNDGERYAAHLNAVAKGEKKLHTGTLMPYEIIRPFYNEKVSDDVAQAIDVTWNAQADFAGEQNALVVVDGSGSMYWGRNIKPIMVAHSLGLYFAERNKGPFANHFITFSRTPQLIEVKGKTLLEKLQHMASFNEVANTNLQAVFNLVLQTAVKNKLPQEKLPERIIIISDMEFDGCVEGEERTNFECAKEKFERCGYKLPKLVFWNVESRNMQLPVTMKENGVTLVSGFNARLFEQVAKDDMNPYEYMLNILGSERYESIVA